MYNETLADGPQYVSEFDQPKGAHLIPLLSEIHCLPEADQIKFHHLCLPTLEVLLGLNSITWGCDSSHLLFSFQE